MNTRQDFDQSQSEIEIERTHQRVPERQMKQNLKIMDKIIRKYKPESDSMDARESQKSIEDGNILSIGLEQVSKHLSKLSKGKLDL